MRIPDIENFNNGSGNKRVIKMGKIEKCNSSVFISSEKDKTKFIKSCEKIIRASNEYREYIQYLKEFIDMKHCSFFTNVNSDNFKKVRIEIHHEPFTLFDLCVLVVNRHIVEEIPLNYYTVAEEVMKLHFQGKVGLIPLSITVHELVHDGKLFIPIQACYGKFLDIIDEYYDYLGEYEDILKEKIRISKQIQDQGYQDLTILDKQYVYLEIDGMTFPTSKEIEK